MSANGWAAISAGAAALATFAALAYTLIEQRAARAQRLLVRHELGRSFEERLVAMYPALRESLGEVEDGLDPDVRSVLVPFLLLYSQVWSANREGLFDFPDWNGLRAELGYWTRKPVARDGWVHLRSQVSAWPEGFVDHVDGVLLESKQEAQ